MNTLYHYCSSFSFQSIIDSKSIWLSSLSLSNDSMEGRLVTKIITKQAKKDGLDDQKIKRLQDSIIGLLDVIDGLGFCLSEKGDLLSQWRGYANDGKGFSIGFSKKYIEKLSEKKWQPKHGGFKLEKVEYETQKQMKLVEPTYLKIKEQIEKGAFDMFAVRGLLGIQSKEEIEKENEKKKKALRALSFRVLNLFTSLFRFKSPAFQEECEWRLISYLTKNGNDSCEFRASPDRIIPYREFQLHAMDGKAITQVIIGPKNITPRYVIIDFLTKKGFKDFEVVRSLSSYR